MGGEKQASAPASLGESRRAVFLDRDGVLNRNVLYADTGAWESPRTAEELCLTEDAGEALRGLRAAGFLLIVVSNQPNAVKGKSSVEELSRIHARLEELLDAEGVRLDEAFYCLHHPEHTGACVCRKPSAYFLLEASRRFHLALPECWMVGDRETDVQCGRAAGARTVWIDTGEGVTRPEDADLVAKGIGEAARLLLSAAAPRTR